eukprot:211676-Rhodomonas_salina.1
MDAWVAAWWVDVWLDGWMGEMVGGEGRVKGRVTCGGTGCVQAVSALSMLETLTLSPEVFAYLCEKLSDGDTSKALNSVRPKNTLKDRYAPVCFWRSRVSSEHCDVVVLSGFGWGWLKPLASTRHCSWS